jgi:hypothetical protein
MWFKIRPLHSIGAHNALAGAEARDLESVIEIGC